MTSVPDTSVHPIRLLGVRDTPLRLDEVYAAVADAAAGGTALIAAVSCPHRAEAFAACGRLVEDLKHDVPIWKHQIFADGDEEWVGAC
ncbi:molybdenum cofactor biosynthesis protein MoaE [Streptomyces sp. NPDC087769]|uniref:molybdenum cofactor biosynthesis protein MoaE n=1 Tax=unclassified Streptomyces TaxID=2593676 RepID=UPI0033F23ACA